MVSKRNNAGISLIRDRLPRAPNMTSVQGSIVFILMSVREEYEGWNRRLASLYRPDLKSVDYLVFDQCVADHDHSLTLLNPVSPFKVVEGITDGTFGIV